MAIKVRRTGAFHIGGAARMHTGIFKAWEYVTPELVVVGVVSFVCAEVRCLSATAIAPPHVPTYNLM
nr:hypothetical protein [Anaerolineae bacterium]